MITALVTLGLFCGAMKIGNFYLVLVMVGVFGFFEIPIIGIGYSFTAMNSLPISPAASCGIAHLIISLFTVGQSSLVSIWIEDNAWIAMGIIGGFQAVGIACSLLVREKVDRSV